MLIEVVETVLVELSSPSSSVVVVLVISMDRVIPVVVVWSSCEQGMQISVVMVAVVGTYRKHCPCVLVMVVVVISGEGVGESPGG